MTFDQIRSSKALVELIVGNDLPFAFAEYSGLNVFVKGLKYFLDVDIVNAAAHVLDPRYKFRFMKEVLRGEDGNDLIDSYFKPMIYNLYQQYQLNEVVDYAPPVVTIVPLVARTTSRSFLELPPISAES